MHEQSYPVTSSPNAGGYAPSPYGAPEPKRRTGLLLAISGLVALVLVAGGLVLFGPLRATSSTEASANGLPTSRTAAGAAAAGEIPTSIEVPAPGDEVPTSLAPVADPSGGAPAPGSGAGPGNSSGNGNPGSGGAPAPQPAPPAPSAPAPVITSFQTPENIDCHNGNFQNFTASWSTTNAVKVTISIDGPGVYKTYGPTGSDSLPFDCSSPHTFLLTAYGHDGSSVSRTITLHPRNVQMPSSGDEDADAQESPAPTPDDEI